jgi:hypothetical protein
MEFGGKTKATYPNVSLMDTKLNVYTNLLELQAQSNAASMIFPTKVNRGFLSNSRRKGNSFLLSSSNNLEQQNTILHPQLH